MFAKTGIARLLGWSNLVGRNTRQSLIMTVLLATTLAPTVVHADEDAPEVYDARVQGYTKTVQLPISSSGLTYFLMVILGGICVGVMFIDAKRSHLD